MSASMIYYFDYGNLFIGNTNIFNKYVTVNVHFRVFLAPKAADLSRARIPACSS